MSATTKIAKDKKRVVSIMPKDLVEKIEKLAFENGRMSVSAYIVKLVDEEVKRKGLSQPSE